MFYNQTEMKRYETCIAFGKKNLADLATKIQC